MSTSTSTKKKAKSQKKTGKKTGAKTALAKDSSPKTADEAAAKKATKADGKKKPKRVSALDAAAQVLESAGKPMRAQELIAAMAEQDLWKSPAGLTPHATLHAAMLREIGAKGSASRFRKVDRGLFAYNG